MNFELKELAIGAALGVAILIAFRLAGIHRERGTYTVLLSAIAIIYVIFALETHEPDTLKHAGIAGGFIGIALAGARSSLWWIVVGLAGHAVFDGVFHFMPILSPAPGWYGPVCLATDMVLAIGLAGFLLQGESPVDMT